MCLSPARNLLFLACLSLTACDNLPIRRGEAEAISRDEAADLLAPELARLEARIEALERKAEALETRAGRTEQETARLTDQDSRTLNAVTSDLEALSQRISSFAAAYNRHTH